MKSTWIKRVLGVLICTGIIAVHGTGITKVQAAGSTIDYTESIEMNTSYRGAVTSCSNKSFYKFIVPISGMVQFEIYSYIDQSYQLLELYNAEGEFLDNNKSYYSSNQGYGYSKSEYYFTAGTYYMKMRGEAGEYSFTLHFTAAGETFQESQTQGNDTFDTAHTIQLNTDYVGQLGFNDDVDFYTFTIPEKGSIEFINNAYINSESKAYYTVYNESGQGIGFFDDWYCSSIGYALTCESMILDAGTYYLKVYLFDGLYKFRINYSLKVAKPTGFKMSANSTSDLTLKWNRVNDATGYLLQKYSNKQWNTIAALGADEVTYTNTNLLGGTLHKYRVCAYITLGGTTFYSKYSNVTAGTRPVGNAIISLKRYRRYFTVRYSKASGATGYQIRYATNKLFKNAKKITTPYSLKSVRGLKSGKRYYVSVRPYKVISKEKYYGAWSKVKSVKVK